MTALDLTALSPEVTLLGATTIVGPSAAISSAAVTGFSDVATATIVVKVERVDNSNGEALSVTVQQSDDGNSWTTAAGPYSFTSNGTQTLAVDAPADRLRVTYSAARGVREATIGSVTARLGVVDAPGGAVVLSDPVFPTAAAIKDSANTAVTVVAAAGAGTVIVPLLVTAQRISGTTAFDGGNLRWGYGQLTPYSTLPFLSNAYAFDDVFAAEVPVISGLNAAALAELEDLPITISLQTESVTGDRVIRITTLYTVITVA